MHKKIIAAAVAVHLIAMSGCNEDALIIQESSEASLESAPSTGALTSPPQQPIAPGVSSTIPLAQTNNIALDATISATFNTPIAISSVNDQQFTLQHDNTSVAVSVESDGDSAVLTPDANLLPSTEYQASLLNGIVDINGTPIQNHSWSFYTAGNGWGPDGLLESDNSGDVTVPQITSNANGDIITVWLQHDGTKKSVYSNRYSVSDDSWSGAEAIEFDDIHDAADPQIAMDANGNAYAVWHQNDGSIEAIYFNSYNASSGVWGTPELLDNHTGDAFFPQIAVDLNGNLMVVWMQFDSFANIYAQYYTASTSTWGSRILIENLDTPLNTKPQVIFDADGNAHAVWHQSGGSVYNIHTNYFDAVNKTWSGAQLLESDDIGSAHNVQIAVDSDNNAYAVWEQSDGAESNILANRYDATTSTWGTAELIENITSGGAEKPQIAIDSNGNAHAVWQQIDGSIDNIYSNRYDASTASWGTATLLEEHTTGTAENIQIATDSDGNAIAVWEQHDGSRIDIATNHFSISTGNWGSASQLESNDAGSARAPQLAFDANGYAHALWTMDENAVENLLCSRFNPHVVAP